MPSDKLRDQGVTDAEFDACVTRAKREGKDNAYAYCNGMPNDDAVRAYGRGRKKREESATPLSMVLRSAHSLTEDRRLDWLWQRERELIERECERPWDELTEDEQGDRKAKVIDRIKAVIGARREGNADTVAQLLTDLSGGQLGGGKMYRHAYLLKGLEGQPLFKIVNGAWQRLRKVAEEQPEGKEDKAAILADAEVEKALDELERVYKKFGSGGK